MAGGTSAWTRLAGSSQVLRVYARMCYVALGITYALLYTKPHDEAVAGDPG